MPKPRTRELFPHNTFYEKQEELLRLCLQAFDNGYKNIVIDAPTGTGKSPINTALLRSFDSAFYTTPQKSLRQQLQNDEVLTNYIEDLKARKDYRCSVTGQNCKECEFYNDKDTSCAEKNCSYWRRKQAVMSSNIATITFSMLIVDGMIPEEIEGQKISFGDREAIAIDEAHGLVQQTRELHAGFDITPTGMPDGMIMDVTEDISWEASRFSDVKSELNKIRDRCLKFVRDIPPTEMTPEEKRCFRLANKIKQARESVNKGSPWVVDVEGDKYGGNFYKKLRLRPIDVSGFLNNFVWSRADKRIISTATLRYRGNPSIWLKSVGLDPEETKVISVGMTFDPKNRPVILKDAICSMKQGGDEDNWDEIMNKVDDIIKRHHGMKGICHTASYSRAERVAETVDVDEHPYLYNNFIVHRGEKDADVIIEDWQSSGKDIIFSPSMMEGIDLKDDKARYNILMKVPFPAWDSVTDYLCNETKYGWSDYFDRAAIRTAQAYGRTTRSEDDWSNFYILDKDYEESLKKKATLPRWMTEAEEYPELTSKSVFDY